MTEKLVKLSVPLTGKHMLVSEAAAPFWEGRGYKRAEPKTEAKPAAKPDPVEKPKPATK